MPVQPTVRDALLAACALGGHVKANGEPGLERSVPRDDPSGRLSNRMACPGTLHRPAGLAPGRPGARRLRCVRASPPGTRDL